MYFIKFREIVCLDILMPRLALALLEIAVVVANRSFFDSLPIPLSSFAVVFLGLPGGFLASNYPVSSHYLIILLCPKHGYPWPSPANPPYRSSLPAGPQSNTPYPHRASVCRFELVTRILLGHVKGSMGEHHLWARPYFSSTVLHVWFV